MAVDYSRPRFDAKAYERMAKRPERRRYVKNREKRKKTLTRAQAREAVYRREKMVCERCKRRTKRPNKCSWEGDPAMAHVNERAPRSKGRKTGSATDLKNLELVCGGCHLPNGEHAPTPERMQKIRARMKNKFGVWDHEPRGPVTAVC